MQIIQFSSAEFFDMMGFSYYLLEMSIFSIFIKIIVIAVKKCHAHNPTEARCLSKY